MPKLSERDMQEAISFVQNGVSRTKTAECFGISKATLSRRVKGTQPHSKSHEIDQKLSKLQEDEVEAWILHEELCGRAPTKSLVRDFAQEVAYGLDRDERQQPLGKNWVDRFTSRHPKIKTKIGRVVDADRVQGINKDSIQQFYYHLTRVRTGYNVQPEDMYNMDETGVQEGESRDETVLGTSATRRARVQKSAATGWVTILHYISALGGHGTMAFIFKGAEVQAQWFSHDLVENEYASSPKGWTNSDVAVSWLCDIFAKETQPKRTARRPKPWRLLVLDGHNTHITPRFMLLAHRMRIALVYLPAHSSEALQPLDVSCFSSLKWHFHSFLKKYQGMKATGPIQKQRMLECYHQAVELAFTQEIIQSGWLKSGVWPTNSSIVLGNTDLFPPPVTPTPQTPPETPETMEIGPGTPRNSMQLKDQVRNLKRKYPSMPRDIYSVFIKATKTIDLLSVELATMRRDNFRIGAEIQSKRPDKRQTVERDPNKIFTNITNIRSAQDKLNKRLRDQPTEDQVPIDSFLEMTPKTRKRTRDTLE